MATIEDLEKTGYNRSTFEGLNDLTLILLKNEAILPDDQRFVDAILIELSIRAKEKA